MRIKKCIGCGATLQSNDSNKDGYIETERYEDVAICRRCFRLKNYNEYKVTTKNNKDYVDILKNISNTGDLVVYVVDIFNLNYDMNMVFDHIKNDVLLVVTKQDIIPKSVKEYKLLEYFKKDKRVIDAIIISANKNHNLSQLYNMLIKYKKSNNVYVVGKTNAGKSTLINKLIKIYSEIKHDITTSYLPSTTLSTIKIKLNEDLTLIDTPGVIDESDIINYLEIKDIKKITPKKEIKPKTFQLMGETSIIVDPFLRIDTNSVNSFTFYMANELEVRRNSWKNDKLKNLKSYQMKVPNDSDIVVNGLLWIKVTKSCEVTIYTYDEVLVYTRDNII